MNLKLKQIAMIERHKKLGTLTLLVGIDESGRVWEHIPKKGWIAVRMNIIIEETI